MVFYFTLTSDPNVMCYMGRDKYENEELIRWGWPEDIWFHVDDHSSAHVYIRMPNGQGMEDLSEDMIEECCQLTKQNSIEGCKLNNVKIVFTPWSNLKKTNGMEVGQIGFHSEKLRRYHTIFKKDNVCINKLEKTRVEKNDLDFRALREKRDADMAKIDRAAKKAAEEEKQRELAEKKAAEDLLHYASLHTEQNMNVGCQDEDDFM